MYRDSFANDDKRYDIIEPNLCNKALMAYIRGAAPHKKINSPIKA